MELMLSKCHSTYTLFLPFFSPDVEPVMPRRLYLSDAMDAEGVRDVLDLMNTSLPPDWQRHWSGR